MKINWQIYIGSAFVWYNESSMSFNYMSISLFSWWSREFNVISRMYIFTATVCWYGWLGNGVYGGESALLNCRLCVRVVSTAWTRLTVIIKRRMSSSNINFTGRKVDFFAVTTCQLSISGALSVFQCLSQSSNVVSWPILVLSSKSIPGRVQGQTCIPTEFFGCVRILEENKC